MFQGFGGRTILDIIYGFGNFFPKVPRDLGTRYYAANVFE